MADEKNPDPGPEDVHLQMRAAVERIRKKFNQAIEEKLKRVESEQASSARAGTDSNG